MPPSEATIFARESRVGSGRGVWGRVGRRRLWGRAPPLGEAEERKPLEEVTDFDRALPEVQRGEVGRVARAAEDMGGGVGRQSAGRATVGWGASYRCLIAE